MTRPSRRSPACVTVIALLAALATGLGPALARAAEPVIVTPAVTEGELGEAARERLEGRLREAVRKSEIEVVEVDAAVAAAARGCTDEGCRAALLGEHGGRFLLVPSIRLDDQDYRLRVTLYGPSGREVATLEETCGLCGLAEAEDLLADLGARISRKLAVAAQAATLAVTSDPPGARVFLGDALIGTTPFELPLDAGAHPLRVEFDGYIGQQRTVELVAGEHHNLSFGLQPVPTAPADAPAPRAKLLTGLGWSALGLGLGAAAGGAALIAIDEQPITSDCAGDNVDAEGNCRWRHATLEPGIALVAGGAVLLGTAVALLVVARKSKSSESPTQARVHVRPSAAGLALSF